MHSENEKDPEKINSCETKTYFISRYNKYKFVFVCISASVNNVLQNDKKLVLTSTVKNQVITNYW